MRVIKTIIVDDEILARKRIRHLLKDDEEIDLIAECQNGKEALEIILHKKTDLLFLDIQMPDLDGFDVLNQLPDEERPFIIFVTAHHKFALKAFEYHALDYLLKPFRNKRFFESLNHAKNHLRQREKVRFSEKLLSFIDEHQNKTHTSTIDIKIDNSAIALNSDNIYFIRSEGNYVRIYVEGKCFLQRLTLQELEQNLNPEQFVRVHRSIIANKYLIDTVHYIGNNEYQIRMLNGHEFKTGRHFKEKILELSPS